MDCSFELNNKRKADIIVNHLLVSGITDENILNAVSEIHRDWFLPEQLKCVSDCDSVIYYDEDRFVIDMATLAHMINFADFSKNDNVLLYPSGLGYVATVLSKFVSKVIAVEENEKLLDYSKKAVASLAIENVDFYCGSLDSFHFKGRYNKVFFNGAFYKINNVISRLLLDNIELVGVRRINNVAHIVKVKQIDRNIIYTTGRHTTTPWVVGFEEKEEFVF